MQLSRLKKFIEIMVYLDKMKGKATSLLIREKFGLTYPQVNKLLKKWEAPEKYYKNLDSAIDVSFVKSTKLPKNEQLLGGPQIRYGLADPDAIFLKDLAKVLSNYRGFLKDTPKVKQDNLIKDELNMILIKIQEDLPSIIKEAGYSLQDKRCAKLSEKLREKFATILN